MLQTLERYQKCSYSTLEVNAPTNETQSSYQEYLKLKARVEILQRTQRNLLGEDLGPLSTKELEQLENQLEMSLKQIRSTKTLFMLDQLSDLKRKEQMLVEANKALKRKLEESGRENLLQLSWDTGAQNMSSYNRQPSHSEGFFQPLDCQPTLQMGYHPVYEDQMTVATNHGQNNVHGFMPAWMT
ncbi:agamous-like MADS-box protein MADS2 [Magnolia sinica]|uniref:agamous-like MADS-box protein MADS2 n=1 Tax=Magnolia sinica TaxID=86752 RepID=UPI00265AEA70|nr:agamous-like MADS-box protein MADS2 [Magnolia sinica]